MSPSEILSKAADLIEPQGAWNQHGYYAATEDGAACSPTDQRAVCFCAIGAIRHVNGGGFSNACEFALIDVIGGVAVAPWNDAPERTQAEVVAALRKAASLAQEKESV